MLMAGNVHFELHSGSSEIALPLSTLLYCQCLPPLKSPVE